MQSTQTPASPFGQPPNAAVPNSFPREYIGTGETVIYETRPSLVPYILGGIIYLIFGLLLTGAYFAAVGTHTTAAGAGFIVFLFIILPILSILLGYLRWTRSAFAMTDKRVLRSSGIFSRSLNDCAHSKVQNTSLRQGIFDRLFGYGHIIFATAGVSATTEADIIRAGGVYWRGVKDPVNTRRFVGEVTEYLARQQKIMEYQDMARVLQATGANMMPGQMAPGGMQPPMQQQAPMGGYQAAAPGGARCARCGTPLQPGTKFCPGCGAPTG